MEGARSTTHIRRRQPCQFLPQELGPNPLEDLHTDFVQSLFPFGKPSPNNTIMQRVMITGGPGSGKSTLARILSECAGIPAHHMDQIHWKSGWIPRDISERTVMCHAIELGENWIFEGGFSTTYDHRAARADTLIWLDLPVLLQFWRVVRRLLGNYGTTRPDMTDNCPEVFHAETLAFWRWIFTSRRRTRARIVRLVAEHPHLVVHHLQSRSQVRAFIASLATK